MVNAKFLFNPFELKLKVLTSMASSFTNLKFTVGMVSGNITEMWALYTFVSISTVQCCKGLYILVIAPGTKHGTTLLTTNLEVRI